MKFIILLFAALFVAANCQFDSIVQVPVDSEVSKSLTLWATEALSNFNGVKYTLSRIIEVKSQQAAKGLKLMIKAEYSFINSMKQQKTIKCDLVVLNNLIENSSRFLEEPRCQ